MAGASNASVAPPATLRVLLASQRTPFDACVGWQELSARGNLVETAGIEETLWLWPLEGYDVLLVDASDQPQEAMELCHLVKRMSPTQRVVVMLGEVTDADPQQFEADAILAAGPIESQFLSVADLLVPNWSLAAATDTRKTVTGAQAGLGRVGNHSLRR
ncbi:MAG TPA: hypothetical protein VMS96_05780 [Terriglobales bacterium]|nr:hypothetical protein [Terriglobales bacterium]